MSALSDFIAGTPRKWATGLNYLEGKVTWAPGDFHYYMRKTTGGGSTDPSADPTNWQPTGDRAVKSIQRGVITIPSNAASATATISSVVTGKSEERMLGFNTNGTDNTFSARVTLTNSTTVTATKNNTSSIASVDVGWLVIERY